MIKAIRGTKDILPSESGRWAAIESRARDIFARFGYREIRTPVIEETALFAKSVGEDTDIVKKEMFSFQDRGERNISLRPEGTAPIVRAYLENNFASTEPFQKFSYIGPMFRAERPQAGRLRQFHQMGVEAIGSSAPVLDAEVIALLVKLLEECGVSQFDVRINNLGCREDKKRLSAALKDTFSKSDVSAHLCEDCKRRAATNPLRVLDCKNERCRLVVRDRFKAIDFLCAECVAHFDAVRAFLDSAGIVHTVDPYIVRGLDYYTRTVFEVTHGALGAQNALGAGGRYDNLTSDMGGPSLGACGFAVGIERLLMALPQTESLSAGCCSGVFIAALGTAAFTKAFQLAGEMRAAGMCVEFDCEAKSLKAQMRSADKRGAKLVVIIGDDELAKGEAVVRDMATKAQTNVPFNALIATIKVL